MGDRSGVIFFVGVAVLFITGFVVPKVKLWLMLRRFKKQWNIKVVRGAR